jgi:hypothetical protein
MRPTSSDGAADCEPRIDLGTVASFHTDGKRELQLMVRVRLSPPKLPDPAELAALRPEQVGLSVSPHLSIKRSIFSVL